MQMCACTTSLLRHWFEEGLPLACAINLTTKGFSWEHTFFFIQRKLVVWCLEKSKPTFSHLLTFHKKTISTIAAYVAYFTCFLRTFSLGVVVAIAGVVFRTVV